MNIWFNHWFSTVYHVFGLVRNYDNDMRIIASNIRENDLIKSCADEWFLEPSIGEGEKYVEYCLNMCKEHKVDVFIPRRGRKEIAKHLDKFNELKILVLLSSDYKTSKILEDKSKMYQVLKEDQEFKKMVPYHLVVNSKEEFKSACVLARYYIDNKSSKKICIKNAIDEGGTSFKVLLEDKKASQSDKMEYNTISEKEMEDIIDKDSTKTRIVMPYLSDEVSCDVLKTSKGVLVVSRKKVQNHTYLVMRDALLEEYCKQLIDKFEITGPCNIQFRKLEGEYKLLDINNRMSGGIQISSLGSGVNIPLIALNQLIGKDDTTWEYNEDYLKDGVRIGNMETPIKLN